MAHIVLFHSALGLRPGVHRFAEQLRAAGHTVDTPDFYDGEIFEDYEAGNKKWFTLGIPTILAQAQAACAELNGSLVLAGFSNGAAVAEALAATNSNARGAILLHGAMPLEMLHIPEWPAAVPVQIHYSSHDPFRDPDNDISLETAVKASGASFEKFYYNGNTHLFTDPDLPDYNKVSAQLVEERVLAFLGKLTADT